MRYQDKSFQVSGGYSEQGRKNFDQAFGKCNLHPDFDGKVPPLQDCPVCRRIWREKQVMP